MFERGTDEKGSAALEFMLSSLVWIPLLMGTAIFGYNLVRAIQVSQFSRDAGHMFAYGVDFTTTQNKTLLTTMAKPLSITATGGNGAIVLSTVTYVTQADCNSVGSSTPCNNRDKYVFSSFISFGNPLYAKTKLGDTVPDAYISGGQRITFQDYVSNTNLQAGNFSKYLTFTSTTQPGQLAYVSEVSVNSQFLAYSGFSGTGSYARTFF